jgi:NAD(P)-dependent dehydrogenase (short-subunit alcohol dehydrogenase family)
VRIAAPDVRLDGRAVVVTGASRGIGAACAVACAQAGADAVVLLGRSRDDLLTVATHVERCGAEATVAACDVTCTASITRAFDAVARVDVLVNGAGANRPEPFAAVREETFDALFALNVRGAFFATQAAVRAMRAAGCGGAVVMVSSQMGHVGAVDRSVYCATKHAIEGLTKALAVELAPEGIRVVSIAPTFVRTAMTAAQLDDPDLGPALLRQIPLGRVGEAEEVAAAVVFAASPAAALVTGSSIVLDGGWTAR